MKKTRTLKGFTLIEMGIVIVIMSVLTGILVPQLQSYISDAEMATDLSNAKLIYDNTSLIISTDDDIMISMLNTGGAGNGGNYRIPKYKEVVVDGKKVKVFDGFKTESYANKPLVIVTRMDGVNRNVWKANNDRRNQGTNSKGNLASNSWDYQYLWEDVGVNDSGNNKRTLRQRYYDENPNTMGHARFIVALSEKMGIPVYGDAGVNEDKTNYPIRKVVHKNEAPEGRRYTDRWQITYERSDMRPHVWVGWHQVNYCYELFPNTAPEYGTEGFGNSALN